MAFINRLPSGGGGSSTVGDALDSHVLSGKTFSSSAGEGLIGSMTNNGAIMKELSADETFIIPEGYHDGNGKVTQNLEKLSAQSYTPSDASQVIPAGKYLEGAQTISPVPTEDRTITAGTSSVDVTRNTGKFMNKVTVNPTPSQSKTVTPSSLQQTVTPDTGKLLSSVIINGDADLVSANVVTGKNIFGVNGTFSADATAVAGDIVSGKTAYVNGAKITGTGVNFKMLDFPLSIQNSQPTGVKAGHIWIKSSTLASKITSIYIEEGLNAGAPNNSLQFIVGETSNSYIHMNETKNLVSGGNSISITNSQDNGGTQEWTVSSDKWVYKLNRPMVYSKIDGVLDIETAYMWNGSAWVILCEKGSYAFCGVSGTAYVYNLAGSVATLAQSLTEESANPTQPLMKFSRDGRVYIAYNMVYYRNGDVYSKIQDIPATKTVSGYALELVHALPSGNGQVIFCHYRYASTSNNYVQIVTYKFDGSTFVLEYQSELMTHSGGSMTRQSNKQGVVNNEGTFYSFLIIDSTKGLSYAFRDSSGLKIGSTNLKLSTTDEASRLLMTYDGSQLITPGLNTQTNGSRMFTKWAVDYTNKTVTRSAEITVSSTNAFYGRVVTSTGLLFGILNDGTLVAYNLNNNTIMSVTDVITSTTTSFGYVGLSISADATKLLIGQSGSAPKLYSISTSGSAVTLTYLADVGNNGTWTMLIPH